MSPERGRVKRFQARGVWFCAMWVGQGGAMVLRNDEGPPGGSLFVSRFLSQSVLKSVARKVGAGEAIRTPDPYLGKVMLYP